MQIAWLEYQVEFLPKMLESAAEDLQSLVSEPATRLVLVEGRTGRGKSALLATWLHRHVLTSPSPNGAEEKMMDHGLAPPNLGHIRHNRASFSGLFGRAASPSPGAGLAHHVPGEPAVALFFADVCRAHASVKALMLKLIADLRQESSLHGQQLVELNTASLAGVLSRALQTRAETIGSAGLVFVVIGGADYLGTTDWAWLPAQAPSNVRFIVSAASASSVRGLRRRAGLRRFKLQAPQRGVVAQHLAHFFGRQPVDRALTPFEVSSHLIETKEKRYAGLLARTTCPAAGR
jgi:hypothetical protein